jgi:hypothetical protein
MKRKFGDCRMKKSIKALLVSSAFCLAPLGVVTVLATPAMAQEDAATALAAQIEAALAALPADATEAEIEAVINAVVQSAGVSPAEAAAALSAVAASPSLSPTQVAAVQTAAAQPANGGSTATGGGSAPSGGTSGSTAGGAPPSSGGGGGGSDYGN